MKKFQTIRDIMEYAIAREIEAHDFYKDLAQNVRKAELHDKLDKFAIEEFQHRIHLEAVRDGEVEIHPDEIGSLDIAGLLVDIEPHDGMKYEEILALAIRKEHAAQQLYTKLAQAASDPETREIFTLLAQEEAAHKLALEIEYDLATF